MVIFNDTMICNILPNMCLILLNLSISSGIYIIFEPEDFHILRPFTGFGFPNIEMFGTESLIILIIFTFLI